MRTPNRGAHVRGIVAVLLAAVFATLLPAAAASASAPLVGARYFGMTDREPLGGADGWPRAQFGVLRLWDSGTAWRQIEMRKGVFDFTRLDAIVAVARQHHVKPLLVLGQTPRFYASHPNWSGAYGRGAVSMPSLRAWRRYVARVASRYGDRIDYQVWNEPNVVGYWRGTQQQMAVLTRIASQVIKNHAPRAVVAAPSFPMRLQSQQDWVDRFYAQRSWGRSVAAYVDVVSFNLYPLEHGQPEDSMDLLASARSIMRHRGVHKPVWNTEINYGNTGLGTPAHKIKYRRQAAYVVRTYVLNAAHRVRRVYWYRWDSHDLLNTHLTRPDDTTPTPAGVAYRVVHRWLAGARVRGCSVSGGTYTCTATYRGHFRRVYWNPTRTVTVRAVWSATSMQGELGRTSRLTGGERLRVGYAPVMVESRR